MRAYEHKWVCKHCGHPWDEVRKRLFMRPPFCRDRGWVWRCEYVRVPVKERALAAASNTFWKTILRASHAVRRWVKKLFGR